MRPVLLAPRGGHVLLGVFRIVVGRMSMMATSGKIIDKNYGSIPHLSTSKLTQQADKKIHPGQEEILTKKARDWRDLIIVTEKIDGSNVGIIRKGGYLLPVSRSGYHVGTSPHTQHKLFERYVHANYHLFDFLPEGWRIAGEWCILSHGTIYDLNGFDPFVAFDIFDESNKRLCYLDFAFICRKYGIMQVPLLHIGQPVSIKNAIKLLGAGHYGRPEKPEGVVYRVERNGIVDFLAKWVRFDKEDGKYLGETETHNIGTEQYWIEGGVL